MDNNIDVQLFIEQKANAVIAHLTFKNNSASKIYLDKQTIYYNGLVRNNYFEITNGNEEEVGYLGRMINCRLLPEDFIELAVGDEIKSTVPLSDFYKMVPGNNYVIQYYAINPNFNKEPLLMEMESNKVEISY